MKTELSKEERGCCLKAMGITAIALVVLVLVVGWLWSRHAEKVRDKLLVVENRWAATGAPLTIDDLIARTPPGDPETFEWLESFGEKDPWRIENLAKIGGAREALRLARESGADPAELAKLEAWIACLGEAPPDSPLHHLYPSESLYFEIDLAEVSDCERHAVHLWVEAAGPRYERALRVLERGPIDWRGRLEEQLDAGDGPTVHQFPGPPITGYLELLRILDDLAILAAREGRTAEALEFLDRAKHAVDLIGEPQTLFVFLASSSGLSSFLWGLERTLPHLPAGTDLSELRSFLSSKGPVQGLITAIESERVHGCRMFDLIRAGDWDGDGAIGRRPSDWLIPWTSVSLDSDRIAYLEAMEGYLEECVSYQRGSAPVRGSEATERADSRVASMLLPRLDSLLDEALEAEVRLQFALAGLRAHAEGPDAALAEITATIDPFSGRPLQARIEEDGTLLMWSVGPDGLDTVAPDYFNPTWRFRKRR